MALLAICNLGNVTLIDLKDDAIGLERSDLKQDFATFDRGTNGLTEVPRDDQTIEWRTELGPLQVLLHECQFGFGLGDLRRNNLHEGRMTLRQGLLILFDILLALTAPFQSFELEIAIVQRTQHLPNAYQFPSAPWRVGNISLKRCQHSATHLRFEDSSRCDTVIRLERGKEHAQRQERQDDQLARHIAWSTQASKLCVQRLRHLGDEPAVLPTLGVEYGASQGGDSLTEFDLCWCERMVCRPLQGEDTEETVVPR